MYNLMEKNKITKNRSHLQVLVYPLEMICVGGGGISVACFLFIHFNLCGKCDVGRALGEGNEKWESFQKSRRVGKYDPRPDSPSQFTLCHRTPVLTLLLFFFFNTFCLETATEHTVRK